MDESKISNNEKLTVIQKAIGLSQTRLAEKFGVSFAAFNAWYNEKSTPRLKMQLAIDDLYLEVTGKKIIPEDRLREKKDIIVNMSGKYKSIVKIILDNPDIRDQFILSLTYNSNKIEGSTLTEPDTAAILFDNVALPNKSLSEHLEAKNHQSALNCIFDHISINGKISEDFILKIHSILMNSIYNDAGTYRRHGVRIVGANLATANYAKIPVLMNKVVKDINIKTDDIVALSSKVHSDFEKIHPFSDGNGRVGRLIMNAMLLKNNVAPAIIRQDKKRLYYTYLHKSQTTNDISQLEDFVCESIIEGFSILDR